jgi:hypothetical protein
LTRRVALALDLPADYCPEYREGLVLEPSRKMHAYVTSYM